MKFTKVESVLKTTKSRSQLWNRINTPQKVCKIEGFVSPKIKKISLNNYEVRSGNYHVLMSFVPNSAVNMTFVGVKNFPMTWFEICGKSNKNCTIAHGEYKRMDSGMAKDKLAKEIVWVKKHFLEELKEIINF